MLKKILVPVDGSEVAKRCLDFAMGVAKVSGGELLVVHVAIPYDFTKVPPRKPKNAIEEAEMAAKAPEPTPLDIAEAYLKQAGFDRATYRTIVDIDPAERIVEYGKTMDAGMIVIGNRGMGHWAQLLIGSVSSKVAQTAECPVVIIK